MSENDDDSQKRRFEQAARKLGVDLDEAKLREALRKMAPDNPDTKKPADE